MMDKISEIFNRLWIFFSNVNEYIFIWNSFENRLIRGRSVISVYDQSYFSNIMRNWWDVSLESVLHSSWYKLHLFHLKYERCINLQEDNIKDDIFLNAGSLFIFSRHSRLWFDTFRIIPHGMQNSLSTTKILLWVNYIKYNNFQFERCLSVKRRIKHFSYPIYSKHPIKSNKWVHGIKFLIIYEEKHKQKQCSSFRIF